MQLAQRLDLAAFRRDPLQIVARVRGVDFTNATLTYGVGLYPDTDPAYRLLTLGMTTVQGANGIRLVRVEQTPAGQPVSILEILAAKSLLAPLPRPGEVGNDIQFAHELQVAALPMPEGLTSSETTLFFGTLTLKGSVND